MPVQGCPLRLVECYDTLEERRTSENEAGGGGEGRNLLFYNVLGIKQWFRHGMTEVIFALSINRSPMTECTFESM